MPHPCPVVELLEDFRRVASLRLARWYVFGAQAVMVHGRPRLTADVDVTLEIDPREAASFVEEMEDARFHLRVADPGDFVARTSVLPFLHEPTGLPLDVVIASSGLEMGFLDRAVAVDLGGAEFPVLRPEDLIVSKMLAGRPKDVEDVEGILRLSMNEIDLGAVRGLLAEIGSAIDEDCLSPLESILESLRSGSG